MKNRKLFNSIKVILLAVVMIFSYSSILAQGAEAPATPSPVKNTFNSILLIDNHTVMVPVKGTFEADIQHRFGLMNNKNQMDLWGLYAPSNIRLAVSYVPIKNLMVGCGITKDNMLADFNAKYAVLRQTSSMPVSVTMFGNVTIDTRDAKDNQTRFEVDRYSYFGSLMVARKITNELSLQVSGNISWMNNVPGYMDYSMDTKNGMIMPLMNNYHISVSALGRYKISEKSAIIAGYDQPITEHLSNNPFPNICFGFETSTSAHSFQIFATTYKSIVPQYNNFYNQNDFAKTYFLLGFNITRLWNW